MSDILISGYYGFRNSGDDALLLAIINDLKSCKEDITLSVLSNSPSETSEQYKIKAINRMNPFSVINNILRNKMLLSGGGTLIQDGTSTKSLVYYLTIICIAKLLGKRIMLYANGIGPLRDEHRKITGKILNKTDIITLRDSASKTELDSLGVTRPKIVITADPAFDLECSEPEKGDKFLAETGIGKKDRFVCISVRNHKNSNENFAEEIAKAADYIYENYGCGIVFLPMQPAGDYEASAKIMKLMKNKSVCLGEKTDIDSTLAIIGRSSLCIGMRLHSLIYSVNSCVPVIGLVYDPKVEGFMDYINQKNYIGIEDVSFQKLKPMIDRCMENPDDIKTAMKNNLSELRKKAHSNAEYAIELLNGGQIK